MHLDRYKEYLNGCRFCPMCKPMCTVGNLTQQEALNTRGRAITLSRIQQGYADWTPRAVETVYRCTLGGRCQEWCLNHYPVTEYIPAARADIVERGLAPDVATAVEEAVRRSGNPWGEDPSDRWDALGEAFASLPKKAEVAYFVGCTGAYKMPNSVVSTLKLLHTAEVEVTIAAQETCCGYPLYNLGFWDLAQEMARRNASALAETGAKRIVVGCAAGFRALTALYPQWGIEIEAEIVPLSRFLVELVEAGRLHFPHPPTDKVTYHDACLTRLSHRDYESPRRLLKALEGVELVEMRWNRELSRCCGAGGGVLFTYPDMARDIALERLSEATRTDADLVVTDCPTCAFHLSGASQATQDQSKEGGKPSPQVMTLTEYLARAL